jgi:cyclic pyranopterin phosphate synthase
MPKEVFGREYQFLDRREILSFEEITRLARIFVAQGVEKVRLTGGEPTLRHQLPKLVEMLGGIEGIKDLTLTTNGSRLAEMASELKDAGLDRVTVSLDSLDDAVFRAMNDVEFPVSRVLEGIEGAARVGLTPVKVNMVVKRGVNERTIVDFARHFKGSAHIVRFIEYMDVGNSNGWRLDDVVTAKEIVAMIDCEMPLVPLEPQYRGEVAERYRYRDGSGEIGVIGSVSQPFCGDCTRARISADGRLYTCLFGVIGHDLRKLVRSGKTDQEIAAFITRVWSRRTDRYSELRASETPGLARKPEMSYIGG